MDTFELLFQLQVLLHHLPRCELILSASQTHFRTSDLNLVLLLVQASKSIQADKRAMYFSDTRFVEQWMIAATQLINRWNQIENYLTE